MSLRVLQNYGIAGSVLTVAALYERRFFAKSTKYRRSLTAATADENRFAAVLQHPQVRRAGCAT
ncbi:MAG: hypothetical protein DMG15_10275 [Acidobacteria bacterium]|nr:MAG: hypothetical protein DMG15_10275 [Acidobacteriota bacterium]